MSILENTSVKNKMVFNYRRELKTVHSDFILLQFTCIVVRVH